MRKDKNRLLGGLKEENIQYLKGIKPLRGIFLNSGRGGSLSRPFPLTPTNP